MRDGGDLRQRGDGKRRIVIADHRNVFRHTHADLCEEVMAIHSKQIVITDDRCDLPALQQCLQRRLVLAVRVENLRRERMLFHGAAVAAGTENGIAVAAAEQTEDLSMPHGDQMLRCQLAAVNVVRHIPDEVLIAEFSVDGDNGNTRSLAALQLPQKLFGNILHAAVRLDDDAGCAAADDLLQQLLKHFHSIARVVQHELIPFPVEHTADAAEKIRCKVVIARIQQHVNALFFLPRQSNAKGSSPTFLCKAAIIDKLRQCGANRHSGNVIMLQHFRFRHQLIADLDLPG